MGYSVAIRCRSEKLKQKMIAFMETNYRPASKVFGLPYDYASFSDNLSYDHAKSALGFDYNSTEPERDYIYNVIRWMAIKIGRKRTWKCNGKTFTTPYFIYDSVDVYPILVPSQFPNGAPQGHLLSTELGIVDIGAAWIAITKKPLKQILKILNSIFNGNYKKYNNLMHKEIQRLETLWNQLNNRD